MGRKCLCCSHKERTELDRAIAQTDGSARVIAERFGVSKKSVLNHRKHIDAVEMKMAHSHRATEIEQILKRVDRLIKLFEHHLKQKPRTALSLDWIRESRDQRGWLTFRAKAMGKIAPAGDGQKREGDRYIVSFVGPDGKPTQIPMAVYRSLPKEAFEDAAVSDGTLGTQSNAPQEAAKDE